MAIIDYVLLILLITCLYTDLTRRKIYNLALLPVLVIALVYHSASGGLPQGWWSLKGLALGTALLIIPFSMGGIGAGDVKLLGVVGACKGPEYVFMAFLAGAIAGGIISVAQLIRHKSLMSTLKKLLLNLYYRIAGLPRIKDAHTVAGAGGKDTIPYGAAIAIGAAAAYFAR
ncbi:MAG: prepilin peptidase [Firmicutes bacterium]|nr:prepilin peptidase [Bacillota bacterium]